MALDRWIALVFVLLCLVYGYAAFFTLDDLLPPFMQRNPVWPSTFPKILAVIGVLSGMVVLLGLEKAAPDTAKEPEINYRRLTEYKLGQALVLLGLMVAYALALRPLGFLLSTFAFLTLGAALLGERRFMILLPVAALATGGVWYLVQEVLGIFLSPLPRIF
ncbi:MAG: TTT family tricarboxylic acid uptake system small permease component [Saliniramus fredricksonii]|uniref:TTT family tricarboxylic acid uptake system small permease component n=1 Tax=Saliniramus fredricksonii TaxID=1653334 RepID=A0A0P7Y787_9HYPH|nr:tripartite tricarboxylate transporter TctB family protein [Saliniramus fredricksonii]KPQ10119.1 MAG: TTT family tricarboxylic acid uptake system small permease component [Saliniramus fredricksonii]SCC79143.1 putative tricarboxylic transport membrane protein [Saliniramus fredricksonii]